MAKFLLDSNLKTHYLEIHKRIFESVKKITGAVDVAKDGTLQAQISTLNTKVTALQGEIEDIGTFYLSTEDGINILTEDGYSLITEQSL